jgi:putative aminopeptidase FrvX
MRKKSLEFLKKLLTTPSPSGFEVENQKNWCKYASEFAHEVYMDSYGNAVAVYNPKGSSKIMLDGHIDEIGLMIKHIDEKGFISVQSIGGVDPALIRSKRVNIHTANGTVRGVIGAPPIHLSRGETESKPPKMDAIFIDIGAKDKKEACKSVAIGDPMTFVDTFDMIGKDIIVGRGLDDRVGAWASIEALRIISEGKCNCAVYACSSIQEETGLNGARMLAYDINPDAAFAIDVTHATDIPGMNVKKHGEVLLGKGPTISIGRENHPVLLNKIRDVAKKKNINLQTETFSSTGGTNALAVWTQRGGIPSMILSIPNRYMHTTVEMLNLNDLQAVADLLANFCFSIKKKESFKDKKIILSSK